MTLRASTAIVALALALVSCAPSDEEPDTSEEAADAGDASDPCPIDGAMRVVSDECIDPWPLTVDSGELRCDGDSVTIAADGNVWAVNGLASSRGDGDEIDPIWADNPDIPGTKINIGGLIDAGLDLCG